MRGAFLRFGYVQLGAGRRWLCGFDAYLLSATRIVAQSYVSLET
jgi:hypothetical protein